MFLLRPCSPFVISLVVAMALAAWSAQAQAEGPILWGLQYSAATFTGFSGGLVGLAAGGSMGALLLAPLGWVDHGCGQPSCVTSWAMRGFHLGARVGALLGLSVGAAVGAQGVLLAVGSRGNWYGAFVGAVSGALIGTGRGFLDIKLLEIDERRIHVEFRWIGRSLLLAAFGAIVGSYWR